MALLTDDNAVLAQKAGAYYSIINAMLCWWHMALPAAMKLELMEYSHILEYIEEYLLNTKALQIDLLVIKKEDDAVIENEIGRIFRSRNVIEYKSPGDALDVDAYFKAYAYACLCKVGRDGKSCRPEDITITMIREKKPIKLLKWFGQKGCSVREAYKGVFYIGGAGFFTTQVIVSRKLDGGNHVWLKSLTDSLDRQQAKQLMGRSKELLGRPEAEYVEALLQVVSKANRELFAKMKEEDLDMYSVLLELFQPEIDEAVDKRIGEAVNEKTVQAIENAIRKLNMSKEEACAFMDTTVEEYEKYRQLMKTGRHQTIQK